MLIVQLKLETSQLWGYKGKIITKLGRMGLPLLFYKNLISKKGAFPNFEQRIRSHFDIFGRMSNFRTRFEQFLTPRTSVRCISPKKNSYFIKMQFFLYFPRSKKIASTDFPISDKSFSANFFSRTGFSLGRASREIK